MAFMLHCSTPIHALIKVFIEFVQCFVYYTLMDGCIWKGGCVGVGVF